MGGRMEFDFGFGAGAAGARRRRDDGGPFRLLLIGDFSGRAAKRAAGEIVALKRPQQVDAADIDATFGAFAVTLPAGPWGKAVAFRTIDDLHPDALLRQLPLFETPRRLRAALVGPTPGDDVFAAVEAWLQGRVATGGVAPAYPRSQEAAGDTAAAPVPEVESSESSKSSESALQRLLGRPAGASPSPASAPGNGAAGAVRSLIESVIRPHLSADVSARRAPLLAALDEALTFDLRAILASSWFRALEGAWRGAERVIRALDTDSDLRIALFDACKQDLVDAVTPAGGGLETSPLHRLLLGEEQRWSLLAADFTFELGRDDLQLLAALGAVASRAGGPLLAGGAPSLLGVEAAEGLAEPATWRATDDTPDGAFWRALRESPLAPFIGLAIPRVLGRLPYGKKTDPIESFGFEELPPSAGGARQHRVWSGAAFAGAQACGAAFRERGWPLDLAGQADIDDLPAHTFDDGGEARLVLCAEAGLGERAAAAVTAGGLIPVLARRDRGAVRLPGFSSIAEPPRPLAWAGDDNGG